MNACRAFRVRFAPVKHDPSADIRAAGMVSKMGRSKKGDEDEAARQNESAEGSHEEKERKEKPEKIERGEEVSLAGSV